MASQPNNTPNEYWDIVAVQGENNAYYVKSFCGKSLDLYQGEIHRKTPIIQWDFHGKKNQMWYIVPKSQMYNYGEGKKKK